MNPRSQPPPQNFSAIILAGGKSSRMGCDKALLAVAGQTLLARQIEMVRETGAAEIFVSARTEADYSRFGCHVLHDDFPDGGPLAGLARGLRAAREPLLLALAVDMAEMRGEFLKELLAGCAGGIGTVPLVNGIVEPLAAFYPKAAAKLIAEMLAQSAPGNWPGAKHFAQACAAAGLVRFITVPPEVAAAFRSWNTPQDRGGEG